MLILESPQSGKTKVLSLLIAKLIQESPDKYYKVLALTCTKNAVAELREYIQKLVPETENRNLLTTFHSFAGDLLRRHGHHIGLKPDFSIMTQNAERFSSLDDAIHQNEEQIVVELDFKNDIESNKFVKESRDYTNRLINQ